MVYRVITVLTCDKCGRKLLFLKLEHDPDPSKDPCGKKGPEYEECAIRQECEHYTWYAFDIDCWTEKDPAKCEDKEKLAYAKKHKLFTVRDTKWGIIWVLVPRQQETTSSQQQPQQQPKNTTQETPQSNSFS